MPSKSSPELRPRPMDAVVALFVVALAIAVAVLYYGALGGEATGYVITHGGAEVARGSLSEERTLTVGDTHHLTITVSDGTIAVTHSDCPTQDCVRTGAIDRPGQTIVCLPEQVVVKLTGDGSGGADLVIG